jgi:hypothetical protein
MKIRQPMHRGGAIGEASVCRKVFSRDGGASWIIGIGSCLFI